MTVRTGDSIEYCSVEVWLGWVQLDVLQIRVVWSLKS